MKGKLDFNINLRGVDALKKKTVPAFTKALEKAAIQWLNWANNGSANSSLKPPIRWGILRGSSSAFVGSKMVLTYNQPISKGADDVKRTG